jgi:hypothetical protein
LVAQDLLVAPDLLVAQDLDRIAKSEAATFDDSGMDAEFGMTVVLPQFGDRIGVPLGGHRIHLGRWTAHDAFGHAHQRTTHLYVLADPIAFRPWRGTAEPDIGAKPATMPVCADLGFVIVQAGDVNETDHLFALIAERMAGHELKRGPALGCRPRLVAQKPDQKFCDLCSAAARQSVRRHERAVRGTDCQRTISWLEHRGQRGDFRVSRVAHEIVLLQPSRRCGIETGVSLCQREGTIPGDAASGFDFGRFQCFGGQAFDRITVQIFDSHVESPT